MSNVTRRGLLSTVAATGAALPLASALARPHTDYTDHKTVTSIAFGSCAHQDKDQPIWEAILAQKPDLFVFLGDNIYGDTRDMAALKRKYAQLAAKPGFRKLREQVPLIATWDDHDYGENDAGAEYPMKEESRQIFLDFWEEPAASPRRNRDGVYTSYMFGPEGHRVQVILLDLRYNRTPLKTVDSRETYERVERAGFGPYLPNMDADATMLGAAQWVWLEEQLRQPADLRILGTSLQCLPEYPGWEAWACFPHERTRLLDLIGKTGAEGLVMISGDTHWAEMSCLETPAVPYPLYELTSSGLTETWHYASPNRHRLDDMLYRQANFGTIHVHWKATAGPLLVLEARNVTGEVVFQSAMALTDLNGRD